MRGFELRCWRLVCAIGAGLALGAPATAGNADPKNRPETASDGARTCEARYRVARDEQVFRSAARTVAECEELAVRAIRAECAARGILGSREVSARLVLMPGGEERLFRAPCGSQPLLRRTQDGPLQDGGLTVYLNEARGVQRQVIDLLARSDFAGLEALLASLRQSKALTSIGGPKADLFFWAFSEDIDHPAVRARIEEWRRARPDSSAARVALVQVLRAAGWEARGGGTAETVTPEGGRQYGDLSELAWQVAEEAQGLPSPEPLVYSYLIDLAKDRDVPPSAVEKYLERGAQSEAGRARAFRSMAIYLHPFWGGSAEGFVSFARRARQEADLATFLRIVTGAMASDRAGFADSFPGWWPELRPAFEEWERAYPSSAYVLEWFAHAACLYKDQSTARRLFEKLGDRWNSDARDAWGTRQALSSARDWAIQGSGAWVPPRSPNHPDALREQCDSGSASACVRLATLHGKSGVVPWNDGEECRLREKACRLGHERSCFQAAECLGGGKPERADHKLLASMMSAYCAATRQGTACTAGEVEEMVNAMSTPAPPVAPPGTHCAVSLRAGGTESNSLSPGEKEGDCQEVAEERARQFCRTNGLAPKTPVAVGYAVERIGPDGRVDSHWNRLSWVCP